jgi:hypothetical protein
MIDIIECVKMSDCKPCSTPVDTCAKLSSDGTPVSDATQYRGLAGALLYLTFTHPNIAYVVQQVCLYMHDPREPHLFLVKRILRYIQGTLDYSLQLHRSSATDLVTYSDTDCAGCPDTCRSTSDYDIFLSYNLVSWSSKRQHTVCRSSAEAEYCGVANVVAKASWLRQLLEELQSPPHQTTIVYCHNISVIYQIVNQSHRVHIQWQESYRS